MRFKRTKPAPKSLLPAPPREVSVNRSMDGLAPKFRAAVERVLAEMRRRGFSPFLYETLRTDERQAYLYGMGREYDDGRGIVTHSATKDKTWHGFGLAVDIICAKTLWSAPAHFWSTLEEVAEVEGLVCGRDWDRNNRTPENFPDAPHLQWGNMKRSPSQRAVELRDAGGNAAVWAEVGAA